MKENEIISRVKNENMMDLQKARIKYGKKYNKIRERNNIDRNADFPRYYKFRTPSNNNWLVTFQKSETDPEYISIESTRTTFLNYVIDNNGIFVANIYPNPITLHNPCFFKQYKASMGLSQEDPLEIVKRFFLNNAYGVKFLMEIDGYPFLSYKSMEGVEIGVERGKGYVAYIGFMSNNELHRNFPDREEYMKKMICRGIEEELFKEDFNEPDYFLRVNLYRSFSSLK